LDIYSHFIKDYKRRNFYEQIQKKTISELLKLGSGKDVG